MAKKIKFPLEMKDGIQVRTIEELKENFDVEKVIGYLLDGKLQTWLSDRYYIQEAEEVGKLDAYAANAKNKLYMIFGIDAMQENNAKNDVEASGIKEENLLKLNRVSESENIVDKAGLEIMKVRYEKNNRKREVHGWKRKRSISCGRRRGWKKNI